MTSHWKSKQLNLIAKQNCLATASPRLPTIEAMSELTRVLDRVQQGDVQTAEKLFPLTYEKLRKLATPDARVL